MSRVRLTPGILGSPTASGGETGLIVRKGEHGIALYGPYEDRPAGRYRVDFDVGLAGQPKTMGYPVCVTLEVTTNEGTTLIAETFLLLSDLKPAPSRQSIEFTLHEPRTLEYRVQTSGQVDLIISSYVEVSELPPLSLKPLPLGSAERTWANEREFLDGYLRNVAGVIHVGANLAQERRYYWLIGVNVLWVEAIPELYVRVVDNIARYPKQRAVNALLYEREGEEVEFQIANNNGASSSILPFEDHATLWPGIKIY